MPWAPSYATVDDLRSFVRVDDSADDVVMSTALDAASRAIDHACDPREGHERQFGKTDTVEDRYFTAVARGYDAAHFGQWIAQTDDIATAAGLLVSVATGTGAYTPVSGVTLLPRNAARYSHPATSVLFAGSSMPSPSAYADAVQITAIWGWPAVPDTIHQACLFQANRYLARRDAPFGVAGSPETGTELRLLARLDPDVEQMVRPFVRTTGAVLA